MSRLAALLVVLLAGCTVPADRPPEPDWSAIWQRVCERGGWQRARAEWDECLRRQAQLAGRAP